MFTDINGAKKAGNSARLRDASEYQKIRSEINRRFNPLAGSTDWDKVRVLCEQLAQREGADLLVAIYYTVAAMKTQGLSAFADGLELQVTVLRTPNDDDMPFAKQAELYRWMLGRIGEEVRAMRPSLEQLRDLYRCERALQSIDRYLSLHDEGKVEDLDVLGYAIFEHIDRIERSAKAQPLVNHVEVVEERKKQNSGALVFAVGLLVGGLGYYGLTLVQGEIATPITVLTEPEKIPKIVSADEASSIHATFSTVQLRESQIELASSYSDQVSILLASKVGDNYASGLKYAESLAHLFPESEESTQIQSTLGQWKNGVEATFTQMQERFETARTRAANVSLLMENGRVDQVKTLAKGLENYAISLSPMVARVSFAEQLIEEGDTERAMAELTIIDNQLKALAMKKVLLMERVQNSEAKVPVN